MQRAKRGKIERQLANEMELKLEDFIRNGDFFLLDIEIFSVIFEENLWITVRSTKAICTYVRSMLFTIALG